MMIKVKDPTKEPLKEFVEQFRQLENRLKDTIMAKFDTTTVTHNESESLQSKSYE